MPAGAIVHAKDHRSAKVLRMLQETRVDSFSPALNPCGFCADKIHEASRDSNGGTRVSKGYQMIQLTRLNKSSLIVNSDLIKLIENAPDTVLTLVTGEKIVVTESSRQVVERIIEFRRRILAELPMQVASGGSSSTKTIQIPFPAEKS